MNIRTIGCADPARRARRGAVSLAVLQMSVGPGWLPRGIGRSSGIRRRRADHGDADQACHRHHRREPQLRPRVRHLRAEARPDGPQSAERRHHQARRQQERHPGPELRQGPPARGDGSGRRGQLPAEPAEAGIPQRPAAGAAGRRPSGAQGYFTEFVEHTTCVRHHHRRRCHRQLPRCRGLRGSTEHGLPSSAMPTD